ncbi:pentapeptide repeat-containing protein [Streptomyces anulatus]|uniref:Pentapeptide repeat-containing protein n=1 Tax=Streptomyces anulatus TaxID=1892 RepID=A0ABZ1ZTC7_STRAQ|nr:pentapeptide repeat-containing protein [Streptomyces anulatus]
MSTSEPPTWPHCAQGADPATDPVGCRGIHVPGHTACLAHLTDADRDAYLTALTPGDSIDHRGTTFTQSLLLVLLNALRDPATGRARLGNTEFSSATFEGVVGFGSAIFEGAADFGSAIFEDAAVFDLATFEGNAWFGSATFEGHAWFGSATFEGHAWFVSTIFKGDAGFGSTIFESEARFGSATFEGNAWFGSTIFKGDAGFGAAFEGHAQSGPAIFMGDAGFGSTIFEGRAGFESATFKGEAQFESVIFKGHAGFESATFKRSAWFGSAIFEGVAGFGLATFEGRAEFESATFEGDAWFFSATFVTADSLGPLVCAGRIVLSGAAFGSPVTLSFAARRLECRRTRWSATAEIRLRYATVDFAHAVFEYPLTIAAEPGPFVLADGSELADAALAGTPGPDVRVASLRGVDAAHLVLADVDLSGCLFTGTVHLDQLRLEGACTFDTAPSSVRWRRWPPVRFTERRVLAEEHHWRASQPGAVQGWNVAVLGAGRAGPLQLAPVYRALRKAFEDGKHEPGAADFYYGEMEMRRHADDIPRGERGLLTAYWALSGYGLRASRALAWLGAAMLLTIVLLMAFGLAQDTPMQTATGTVPAGGGKVTFEIDKDDPQNPTGDRFTGERFEKALNVTLNSVVFRSSGQDLTTAGTYIEMTSRLTEPVLLGLAVLAVRNRVKR